MLAQITETIQQYIANYGSYFRLQDLFDIIIVAFVFYKIIGFIHETRAMQLIKGIVLLLVVLFISDLAELNTINYVLRNTLQVGVLAIVVIFQPELRRALEKMGTATLKTKMFGQDLDTNQIKKVCDEISSACAQMSSTRTGCLIVLERASKLSDVAHTGVKIDSLVSEGLLINMFVPNTPLHDGAMLLSGDTILAAGCFLPLSENTSIDKNLGTRHRAALGISERTDALVIIVSEETGVISVARGGSFMRFLDLESLKQILKDIYKQEESEKGHNWTNLFTKFFGKEQNNG